MEASTGSGFLTWIHRKTPPRMNTYTAYSIGTFVAWAVIWAVLGATEKKVTLGYVFAIFFGWCIGWLSAHDRPSRLPAPEEGLSDRRPTATMTATGASAASLRLSS